jgi:hypothetical protein
MLNLLRTKAGATVEVDHATLIMRGRSFSSERSDLDLPGPRYGSSSRSQLLARESQRSKSPPQGCACRGRPTFRRDDANQCNTNLCEMSLINVTCRCTAIARSFAAYEDGFSACWEYHEAGRVDSDPVHRQKRDEWGVSVAGAPLPKS